MKVLLLGPHSNKLIKTIIACNCSYIQTDQKINQEYVINNNIGFIISFGFRFIIKPELVKLMKDRVINIHISYLPWNKGADPNFWSFIDNTPKGVTIHYIDDGVDTGDIIDQFKTSFDIEEDTLTTSYEKLIRLGVILFERNWPFIKKGRNNRMKQKNNGTFHKVKDKEPLLFLLEEKKWDTPIKKLIGFSYGKK